MKYAYQRGGAPLIQWGLAAPRQSRAADTVALGSLSGTSLSGPTLVLPAPGAPEPILGGLGGCSCSGSCGCGQGVGDFVDAIPGGYLTLGVAVAAWFLLRKKRR